MEIMENRCVCDCRTVTGLNHYTNRVKHSRRPHPNKNIRLTQESEMIDSYKEEEEKKPQMTNAKPCVQTYRHMSGTF